VKIDRRQPTTPSRAKRWTGEIINNLGGAKTIKSASTGLKMDRDLNGARGIFLRALVDTPWLRASHPNQMLAKKYRKPGTSPVEPLCRCQTV
jgi:hypothetical protein